MIGLAVLVIFAIALGLLFVARQLWASQRPRRDGGHPLLTQRLAVRLVACVLAFSGLLFVGWGYLIVSGSTLD